MPDSDSADTALTALLASLSGLPPAYLHGRNRALPPPGRWQEAAVLLGVVPHENRPHIILTRRSSTLRQHTGQTALPGGRRDAGDSDLTATALREAHEEIGTPPAVWQTFAPMPPLYSPSGYAVSAVPALSRRSLTVRPSENEVAEVFYLPLARALNPENYRIRAGFAAAPYPVYELPFGRHDIWGLTAAMLYALAEANRLHGFFPANPPA
ncbi:CoA pyrophosphatase [Neisseria leonii]|uniref:CoA pyrophosphatase n=1 Tax=Neisseria leonii TaxID=2995413 RepID=A0A9X4E3S6_9NEIS|nr:CoA pyrophosphatase [Neisseria sp. 51.81]MDD9327451.1 CoA pyrophosphatase [Neisseria sp. 51.81]